MQHAHRTKLHHIEFYVADVERHVEEMTDTHGFRIVGRSVEDSHRSVALRQGGVTIVYTQARAKYHPASAHVEKHGDAPADIWLVCEDAEAAFDEAVARGAVALELPRRDDAAGCITAAIRAFGSVRHTFLQWLPSAAAERVAPGIVDAEPDKPAEGVGVLAVDHFAVCIPAGELDATVTYYRRALGFEEVFEERIVVGRQSMLSRVVKNQVGDVTLTIIEPDRSSEPGQIDKFINDHNGAGIQHIAFACRDVVDSVRTLRDRGVSFLPSPASYYERLPSRLTLAKYDVATLQELGLLADSDHDGQLFQVFMRSTHPRGTFFFEMIERLGAKTFGSGNIRALYEAVEQDLTIGSAKPEWPRGER